MIPIDCDQQNAPFAFGSLPLIRTHVSASFLFCSASVRPRFLTLWGSFPLAFLVCVKVYVADKGVRVRGAKYANVLLPHCQQSELLLRLSETVT